MEIAKALATEAHDESVHARRQYDSVDPASWLVAGESPPRVALTKTSPVEGKHHLGVMSV
jgi:hypothetical protein